MLPGIDAEVAGVTQDAFERQGLALRLGCRVTGVPRSDGGARLEVDDGGPVEADRVLLAAGRAPTTRGLGLETLGVTRDRKGFIAVDEATFETSVAGVFAVGDVIGEPMLAHKASEEGVACVERMVTGHGHVDYAAIPAVVYTHPEIAAVGATEAALAAQGARFRTGRFPFRNNPRARCLGDTEGVVKVLADAGTDRIRGVHAIGPRAGDLIAEAATAIAFAASSEDAARACHAHPTLAEALREAALAVDGRAVHG